MRLGFYTVRIFQHRYGRPEDIGFITADDW
jgi:hypothetical protein